MHRRPFFKSHPILVQLACAAVAGSCGLSNLSAQESPQGLLLVANKGSQTLSIVDPAAGITIANIPEDGVTGHEVAATADGKRAFVPIYGNSGVGGKGTDGSLIRVIDLTKHNIVGTIDLGKGLRPHCAVMGPADGRLYVTTELGDSVTVIDVDTLNIVGAIPTGQAESHMLAISHDGKRGYTANVGPGTVSVLDLVGQKLVKVIPVSAEVQRISISKDNHWVFTADQSQPRLAVIDTTTNAVTAWIDLPSKGFGATPTPDGRWLLVALNRTNQVGLIDLQTLKLVKTLDVPKSPQEIVVQPDGAVAYVSCDASRQVAVIDLENWRIARLINAGPGADGLAWAKQSQ